MEEGDRPLNWRNSMKARTGVGEAGGGRGRRYKVKTVRTIEDERDEPLWSWVCMLVPTA